MQLINTEANADRPLMKLFIGVRNGLLLLVVILAANVLIVTQYVERYRANRASSAPVSDAHLDVGKVGYDPARACPALRACALQERPARRLDVYSGADPGRVQADKRGGGAAPRDHAAELRRFVFSDQPDLVKEPRSVPEYVRPPGLTASQGRSACPAGNDAGDDAGYDAGAGGGPPGLDEGWTGMFGSLAGGETLAGPRDPTPL